MKQWPGYLKAETDGIKVYDSSDALRVLLGSWLSGAIRKYGLKIIGGEIYSSEYRTGVEGDKTYLTLKPSPASALELWTNINGTSYKQFELIAVDGAPGAALRLLKNGVFKGYMGLDSSDRIALISTDPQQIYLGGDVTIAGGYTASGTKSAVVPTLNYGIVKLYGVEAPEVLFSDRGRAQLINGEATVKLDPAYLECIEPDTDLTPWLFRTEVYGLGESIRVVEWGDNYFKVKEENGGTSNRKFGWWHEAVRKGYAGIRLMEVVD